MTESSIDVGVIVLTMNQCEKTLRCLQSFSLVTQPSHRVLLWDNGSSDGTVEVVRERFPEVLAHHHPENLGVASGRNRAAELALKESSPRFLLFIDNDMTVEPEFLATLIAPFEEDERLAHTTGKIRDMDQPEKLYGAGGCRIRFWRGDTNHVGWGELDRGQHDRATRCIPSGGCNLIRTNVFQELGGFDPVYDPYGPEDLDFGLRAVEAGYHGIYVPEAVVYHDSEPGRTFEPGHYTEAYASNRSKHWFRFMRRHASIWQQLGFYAVGGPYLLSGLMIREAKKGNLLPAVRGLVRGFLGRG